MRFDTHQLDSMKKHRHGAFLDRLERDILTFMASAEPNLSPMQVSKRFDLAIETAEADRIETEQDWTRYCYILCALPLDYRSDPAFAWMLDLLGSNESAQERLDRLSAVLESDSAA